MADDFGAFITSRRRELELTLGDVADELDVSPITVSNWSNGQSVPDGDDMDALASLLQVPVDDLSAMAGVESPPAEPVVDSSETGPVEIDIPEPDPEPEADPPESEVAEPEMAAVASNLDDELAEMIEEASAEVEAADEIPTFVEPETPAPTPPPAPAKAATAPRGAATATAERAVVLPLTYIEDPKQLMRYRIRWGLTLVVLLVMAVVLLWASSGLISALSDIKESVTPGGGS